MPHSTQLDYSVVLPDHLTVGYAPNAADVATLRELGVDAVLSVVHESDPYVVPEAVRQAFDWAQVPVVDSYLKGVPTVAHLEAGVRIMRDWRREGKTIYVHCLTDQGRSPLMAMAYLVAGNDEVRDPKAHRLTAAIAHVRQARPKADPNVHQLRVLCEFVEAHLQTLAQR
jgi:protein-tyrosine phosphatase